MAHMQLTTNSCTTALSTEEVGTVGAGTAVEGTAAALDTAGEGTVGHAQGTAQVGHHSMVLAGVQPRTGAGLHRGVELPGMQGLAGTLAGTLVGMLQGVLDTQGVGLPGTLAEVLRRGPRRALRKALVA